jgi:hypothetical protein
LKRFVAILILLVAGIAGADFKVNNVSNPAEVNGVSSPAKVNSVTASVCTADYTPSVTIDGAHSIGRYNAQEYVGFTYVPTASRSVCQVDIWVQSPVTGSLSGKNYYCEIYSISSGELSDRLGLSDAVAGTTVAAGAGGFVSWAFSTPVALTQGTTYGVAWFVDTDSNLTDDPEIDGSNYFEVRYDDELNGDSIQTGLKAWAWDSSIPYSIDSQDPEDDFKVQVHTLQ